MKNILILKRDKLGDVILTSYLVNAVKRHFPEAHIDFWVTEFACMVNTQNPKIRHTYPIIKLRGFGFSSFVLLIKQIKVIFGLRKNHYDVVFVAGGEYSHKAISQAWPLRFRDLVAFCPPGKTLEYPRLSHPAGIPRKTDHEAVRILELFYRYCPNARVESLGTAVNSRPSVGWDVSTERLGRDYLRRHSLLGQRYAVIGLGARKPKRQPSSQQVRRWAKFISSRYGMPVILSFTPNSAVDPGYPNDEKRVNEIREDSPELILLGGSIEEAVGVVREATLVVMPDSGLMHAASTGLAGVVGLFADIAHSPSPEQWGPVGPRCTVVIGDLQISDVPDEEVYAKISQVLHDPYLGAEN